MMESIMRRRSRKGLLFRKGSNYMTEVIKVFFGMVKLYINCDIMGV